MRAGAGSGFVTGSGAQVLVLAPNGEIDGGAADFGAGAGAGAADARGPLGAVRAGAEGVTVRALPLPAAPLSNSSMGSRRCA